MKNIKINDKIIGDNHPCYVAAEIGSMFKNFVEAKNLIDAAIKIELDAVKIQTFEADTITTKNNMFDLEVTGNIPQFELFKKMEISKDLQLKVVNYANDCGITIFSAPSHINDLELMNRMNPPAYKIGSDLACHIPLLKQIASYGKPIILSTGMCNLDEIHKSVDAIRDSGNEEIILLHCISDYPAKIEEVNLKTIEIMKNEFDCPVGFSDHTLGSEASLAAIAMGANMVEKHFMYPENPPTPDSMHALSPEQFSELIQSKRLIEKAMGTGIKIPTKSENNNKITNRVSIIAIKDISEGEKITKENIDVRRPGIGIQPIHFEDVLKKTARIKISKETPITWEVLQ